MIKARKGSLYSRKFPTELKEWKRKIEEAARVIGVPVPPMIYEVVSAKEMAGLQAYHGLPARFNHWSFGMNYDRHLKETSWHGSNALAMEMVCFGKPVIGYLQEGNSLATQKAVIAHAGVHGWYMSTNQWTRGIYSEFVDEFANHSARIAHYIQKHGLEKVEKFLDACLSAETLIDINKDFIRRKPEKKGLWSEKEKALEEPGKIPVPSYLDSYVNPKEYLKAQEERIKKEQQEKQERSVAEPERDILLFLLERGQMAPWERDILSMIREEAYYFAPIGRTKTLNEGCIKRGTLVETDRGILPIEKIVENQLPVKVFDGKSPQRVTNWFARGKHRTVRIRTQRGLELEGSVIHRLMLADGTWKYMDELQVGDKVRLTGGGEVWASEYVPLNWSPQHRLSVRDVADQAGLNWNTVYQIWRGNAPALISASARSAHERRFETLDPLLKRYEAQGVSLMQNKRKSVRIPSVVDEDLGAFLGYLIGDGHINIRTRCVGFTTGDIEARDHFVEISRRLFGIEPKVRLDGKRWRVYLYRLHLIDFLRYLGIDPRRKARKKKVPSVILRSPRSVVRSFLRAYFDCDGYGGNVKTGKWGSRCIVLSTSSRALLQVTQRLLLNFGILSAQYYNGKGNYRLHIEGASTKIFLEKIGFGLPRKQTALQACVDSHRWFFSMKWEDEVAAVQSGEAEVYDLTVEETHCYSAHGFVNHNCATYFESLIMTGSDITNPYKDRIYPNGEPPSPMLDPGELIDYADEMSRVVRGYGFNPYRVGVRILRDIEERWNKGCFGKEWEECDSFYQKKNWNQKLGLGRAKIFEVCKMCNDISFIDAYLTQELVDDLQFFVWKRDGNKVKIKSRELSEVKRALLYQMMNLGRPTVEVTEVKKNGDLHLTHRHDGVGLDQGRTRAVLSRIATYLWRRGDVCIQTYVGKGKETWFEKGF